MSYGVTILDLKRVIEITEIIKDKSIERFMAKPGDEDLQQYRDYQVSLLYYLQKLPEEK